MKKLDGNFVFTPIELDAIELEITQLQEDKKKLIEALEFYGDLTTVYSAGLEICEGHCEDGGTIARKVLKEIKE